MDENEFNEDNTRLLLAAFIEKNKLDADHVARAIGCRKSTLIRILAGDSVPTEEFIKQAAILLAIGFEKYEKLTEKEKENIAEGIGAAGGGVVGFAAIAAAISASGSVAGLSAAGITSGLAAMGGIVSGGMAVGVAVAAAIPLAVGALGYGIISGVRFLFSEMERANEEFDERWETEV
tara:strand:- start:8081 stop:8614 length:534 start_codon:yes stop_codon:yes gene_type:complete